MLTLLRLPQQIGSEKQVDSFVSDANPNFPVCIDSEGR